MPVHFLDTVSLIIVDHGPQGFEWSPEDNGAISLHDYFLCQHPGRTVIGDHWWSLVVIGGHWSNDHWWSTTQCLPYATVGPPSPDSLHPGNFPLSHLSDV